MKLTKRIFALALALCLILCLSISAFAEEKVYDDMSSVTLTKVYEAANSNTTSPEETFGFGEWVCTGIESAGVNPDTGKVVTKDDKDLPMPTIASVYYDEGDAGVEAKKTKEITITLPRYNAVGVYIYQVYENDNGTAGVTYRKDPITLKVTVIEQNNKIRVAAVHTEGSGETKSDTFTNTYSAGKLSISKTVTGNLGDKLKEFEFTVTFTKPEGKTVKSNISYKTRATEQDPTTISQSDWNSDGTLVKKIYLKNGETIEFTNIPYGVSYTVSETADANYTTKINNVDKTATDGKISTDGKIEAAETTVAFENRRDGNVDTGVYMDSLPYILALAVALGGAVVLFTRKRHIEE